VNGSGLGLSMVQGFVEQSGGRFRITSRLGQGTSVELRLPSAQAVIRHERQDLPQGQAQSRILLVDDSLEVLETTGLLLEKSGFTVVRAGSGDKALALLAEGERFDVMMTDYAMPGRNGAQLIAATQVVQPGLKALLITGYAGVNSVDALPEGTEVLHKPFKRANLVETLQRMLADKRVPHDLSKTAC
jgi:CheY-like chemotaxis protein